jgi:hypothetical protein
VSLKVGVAQKLDLGHAVGECCCYVEGCGGGGAFVKVREDYEE